MIEQDGQHQDDPNGADPNGADPNGADTLLKLQQLRAILSGYDRNWDRLDRDRWNTVAQSAARFCACAARNWARAATTGSQQDDPITQSAIETAVLASNAAIRGMSAAAEYAGLEVPLQSTPSEAAARLAALSLEAAEITGRTPLESALSRYPRDPELQRGLAEWDAAAQHSRSIVEEWRDHCIGVETGP